MEVYSIDFFKMIGKSPEVLNFNQLFLKLNGQFSAFIDVDITFQQRRVKFDMFTVLQDMVSLLDVTQYLSATHIIF